MIEAVFTTLRGGRAPSLLRGFRRLATSLRILARNGRRFGDLPAWSACVAASRSDLEVHNLDASAAPPSTSCRLDRC
jgi:hypothetical protein